MCLAPAIETNQSGSFSQDMQTVFKKKMNRTNLFLQSTLHFWKFQMNFWPDCTKLMLILELVESKSSCSKLARRPVGSFKLKGVGEENFNILIVPIDGYVR